MKEITNPFWVGGSNGDCSTIVLFKERKGLVGAVKKKGNKGRYFEGIIASRRGFTKRIY